MIETTNKEYTLPTIKSKIESENPTLLVFYSPPKTGKTTLLSKLENCLIIDLENGAKYLEALKVKVDSLEQFKDLGRAIIKQGKPYKYIAIDTITKFEEILDPYAIELYRKTPMGKNYQGDSILTLPNGAGYLYYRLAFKEWLEKFKLLADHVILVGHLKDKMITDKKGDEVASKDLDLTGKLKTIACSDADAIGYLYRDNEKLMMNFQSTEEVTCGARPKHLKGQRIHIADYDPATNDITAYWDRIYVK